MAYTTIAIDESDDHDGVEDIESQDRYSSVDIIVAAPAENKISKKKKKKEKAKSELKSAYSTTIHAQSKDEIEKEYNTSFTNGLTPNQVESLQQEYGLNQVTPEKKKVKIKQYINLSCCMIITSLSLCIAYNFLNVNLFIIVLSILIFIFYILSVIAMCYINNFEKSTNNFEKSLINNTLTANVIRHQPKKQTELLIESFLRISKETKINIYIPSNIVTLIHNYSKFNSLINPFQLVLGDIVLLKKGDKIHADMRVIECSNNFKVDNSSLTGESEPQIRNSDISNDLPSEARNLCFTGTHCVEGEAKCVVFRIGDYTFMGKTMTLEVKTIYQSNYEWTIKWCSNIWSCALCFISIIFMILGLTLNVNIINIINIIWFVIGSLIILFAILFIGQIWISIPRFMSKIKNNIIVKDFVFESEIVDTLSMINIIVIGTKYVYNNKTSIDYQQIKDLGIKLIILMDSDNNNNNKLELITNNIGINNPQIINIDDMKYGDIEQVIENIEFKNDNIIVCNTTPLMKLLIVAKLQDQGNIVMYIGNQTKDTPAMKKSDVSSCINIHTTETALEASDIILLGELNDIDPLKQTIETIKTAKKCGLQNKTLLKMR